MNKKTKGFVQIYTGDGKGKTTCAMGLCMRASGQGKKVVIIGFLKTADSGEHISAKKLGISLEYGQKIDICPWDQIGNELWRKHSQGQIRKAAAIVASNFDVVVVDEIFVALEKQYITIEDVLKLISNKNEKTELVLTGRNAPKEIIDQADLVTQMTKIKHYFDVGVESREGIEF